MGSAASPLPYQSVESTTRLAPKYEALLGFNKDSSEYSPFQALSRQAGTMAKMYEGITTKPTWSSLYQYYGVPQGTDLTPYIQATRSGTALPTAPIPTSPEAGTIPEFTPPADTGKAPKKKAAQGGLMSLARPRGYAAGGQPKTMTSTQAQVVKRYNNLVAQGKDVPDALIKRINTIEERTGRNVSPFVDTGTAPVRNAAVQNAIAKAEASGNYPTAGLAGSSPYQAVAQAFPDSRAVTTYKDTQKAAADKGAPSAIAPAGMQYQTAFYDPTGQAYNTAQALQAKQASGQPLTDAEKQTLASSGAMLDPYGGITNPVYRQALDQLRSASTAPETIGQGAGIMSTAASKLMDQAGSFTPQQVTAEQISAKKAETEDAIAAAMARGDVRDVAALRADVEKYNAALMTAPKEAEVKDYQAAQMNAAEMARARDVNAPTAQAYTYGASQMAAPSDVIAADYTAAQARAAQMRPVRDVTGQTYSAADIAKTQREQGVTTAAPKSWTDAGTAAQYMNPYMQNVVDIQKREAGYDYAKRLNELSKQAVGAKAYGGSRLAVERANAARDQAMLLNDIEEKGLQQAYQSGMGQFSTEQGLGSQVGMSNTAQINQLKSQYMSMGLTEAQADQAARNQAAQFGAQSAQQAALANQQAGLTIGQANLSAAQQTALANQNAINQQRQTAVNNALQAAMTSYGGKLTAAQQNMIADNATKQFNAQNQTQISQANAQMNLASQQSNQAADLTTNQANAQFIQQANAANQAAINQQRQNYVNNALQAAMQSYSGQLTAAQQNQIAQNAAAQFNAQAQNTANNNFAAQSLQANLANQQMDFGVGQLNTQNQQAANMYNAQAQNQANQQFATQNLAAQQANQQAALTAGIQNQQAGLTGQGLNLQALNQAGQMGQGIGSLGLNTWGQQQNVSQLWGAAGQTAQGIAQSALDASRLNAGQIYGGMQNSYQAPVTLVLSAAGQQGTQTTNRIPG